MIDDVAFQKIINEVDGTAACKVVGDFACIHSRIFTLELPYQDVKKLKWPGPVVPGAVAWRSMIPAKATLSKAIVTDRETLKNDDGKPFTAVRLTAMSSDESRLIDEGYYELYREHLDNPVFKIILGTPTIVVIFDDDRMAGVLAPLTERLRRKP